MVGLTMASQTLYTEKYAPTPSLDKLFTGLEDSAKESRKREHEKEMLAARQKGELAQAQQKSELDKMLEVDRETRLQQREAEKGSQLLNMIGASAGATGAVVPGVTQPGPTDPQMTAPPTTELTPGAAKSPLAASFLGDVYKSGVKHEQKLGEIKAQREADLAEAGGMIDESMAGSFREAWTTLKEKGDMMDAATIYPLTIPNKIPVSEVPKYATIMERVARHKRRDETILAVAKEVREGHAEVQRMKNEAAAATRKDKLTTQDIARLREIRLGINQRMDADQARLEWASRELLNADLGPVDQARMISMKAQMTSSIRDHSTALANIEATLQRGITQSVEDMPKPAPTGVTPPAIIPNAGADAERAARLKAADTVWKTKMGKKPLNTWSPADKEQFEKDVQAELANTITRKR